MLNLNPGNDGHIANSIAVSFKEGSKEVTYWRCDAVSNCLVISKDFYEIVPVGTEGDRKLTLFGLPFEVAGRIFVQRGSTVYYGDAPFFIDRRSMTLNEPLTEALFGQLRPETVTDLTR